jgi:hypothetical protein
MANIINIQSNLTWTTDGNDEPSGGLILYASDNNYAIIGGRETTGAYYRVSTYDGGILHHNLETAVAKAKDVKIQYDFNTHAIHFYYWNTSVWTEMGTGDAFYLGQPLYAVFSSADSTSGNGANPYIFDNFYISHGAYSTQYPAVYDVTDAFTGSTIDVAKWTETDPNGRISQSHNVLNYANPHSNNRTIFTDKLQSVFQIIPEVTTNYLRHHGGRRVGISTT